eukprot:gi/632985384/ref/XP_007909652.1/ PREDICTED: stromelysin-3-like isoform X1 [Callorhinchus milii]
MLSRAVLGTLLLWTSALPTPTGHPQENTRTWFQKFHFHDLKQNYRHLSSTGLFRSLVDKAPPGLAVFKSSDTGLMAFLNPRRCGVPDLPQQGNGHSKQNRQKRFVIAGDRWNKTDLTYKIVRFPWQLSKVKVQRTIAKAVKVWSDVTPLTFTEVQEGGVDIIIDFSRYWHGDNLPFDGPGGVLAHAFYPRTPRAGNVHFDYDEMWTIGNNKGTDLLQVAAHEFGHALGLQHSTVPKSLMSPYYSFRYPLSLAEDDKQGIQYLYGRPQHTSHHRYEHFNQNIETNELPSSHNPTQEPNACDTDFDAVSMIRGELFFFKSKYVWRLRDQYLQPGYPALASRHWWGIPDHIDAAFEDSSGNFWFFQGARYWIYDGENQVSGPKFISELGLSANGIEAALKWALEKNEKILFFKGSDYWRFNMNTNHVDNIYPSSINDWRGIPHNIDGTFQDEYGELINQ